MALPPVTPGQVVAVIKAGQAVVGEVRTRAAIRESLWRGAYSFARDHGASNEVAEGFAHRFLKKLDSHEAKPKSWARRIVSRFRGGPATLFDRVEARDWARNVRRLAERTASSLAGRGTSADLTSWWNSTKLTPVTAGAEILEYVETAMLDRQDPASLDFLSEQTRVDAEREYRRRHTPTFGVVSRVVFVGALGGLFGHVADVKEPVNPPDWVQTGVGATAALATTAALALRASGKQQELDPVTAALLSRTINKMRVRLEDLADLVRKLSEQESRGPPGDDQSYGGTDQARFKFNDEAREQLRLLTDRLLDEARLEGLADLDPAAMQLTIDLQASLSEIWAPDPTISVDDNNSYQRELECGAAFVRSIALIVKLGHHLDVYMSPEPEPDHDENEASTSAPTESGPDRLKRQLGDRGRHRLPPARHS